MLHESAATAGVGEIAVAPAGSENRMATFAQPVRED